MIPAPLHWSWHRHPEYPGKHSHEPSGWHVPISHGRQDTEQSSPAYPSPPNTFSTDESHAHVPLTVAVNKTQKCRQFIFPYEGKKKLQIQTQIEINAPSKILRASVEPVNVAPSSTSVVPTPSSYPIGG